MPKYISEIVRQNIIDIATQNGFKVQLKSSGKDLYLKVLKLYSLKTNQTIYIRKDRGVGSDQVPKYFQIAVHPDFFKTEICSVDDGIKSHIIANKHRNLSASSYYQEFPVFEGNNEPCGICYKVDNYLALGLLLSRLVGNKLMNKPVESDLLTDEMQEVVAVTIKSKQHCNKKQNEIADNSSQPVESSSSVPIKGLIIKSPFIERILAGTKTWEIRSSSTTMRGPIALIKKGSGQVVGVANLVDTKGPLSQQEKLDSMDKHQISVERLESGETDKWNTAWVLENAQPLITPVNYSHPNGAVIWVKLEPQVQNKIEIAIQQ